jgi:hypothetical protein
MLYTDNDSAIKLTKNPEYHKRSKHIDMQHFYVRERYVDGAIGIGYIDERTLADLLTKPIERVPVETMCTEIGITPGEQLSDLCSVLCMKVFWRKF